LPLIASLLAPSVGTAVHPTSTCPRLFGTPEIKAANTRRRMSRVHWIEVDDRLEIAHGARWKQPEPVYFPGVDVVEITSESARIRLDERFERLGCPAGDYAVRLDEALGEGNRVVGLVPGVMLVELGRRLAWVGAPGVEYPKWRMIWGSPYYFLRRSEAKAPTGRRPAPVRRPPPRRPPARR
jgi:hypothetical protein